MDYIKTKQTTIIREGVWESIVKDAITFAVLFILFYLNHAYTDGSWFIDFVIAFLFVITSVAKASKDRKEMTLDETTKYLESKKRT
jgi:TRAP-type uncharacterized transport system fused permease subunit